VCEQIHRSKNLLMTLQAVVRRTISEGRDVTEMREALLGRLRAIARAYHLVSAADGTGVEISEVVEAELADVLHRVTASGPPARLSGSAVQTFALVLHELAANAVEHGSLGSPDGSVAMGWTFFEHGPDRYLEAVWTERGGPPPREPSGYGFGLTLISSFANSGPPGSNVTFDETGLICRMRLPQNIIVAN
jgi:two-component sensor histidine kinase